MPHYFFHVRTETALVHDTDGEELSGPEDARRVAAIISRALIAEARSTGRNWKAWMVDVTDELDRPVLSFPVLEAMH